MNVPYINSLYSMVKKATGRDTHQSRGEESNEKGKRYGTCKIHGINFKKDQRNSEQSEINERSKVDRGREGR